MDAADPATGSLLPLQQFFAGSSDAALARRRLFGVIDPADELVATDRRQAFPQRKDVGIRSQRCLHVVRRFVDNAVRKSVRHETSSQCHPAANSSTPHRAAASELVRSITESP